MQDAWREQVRCQDKVFAHRVPLEGKGLTLMNKKLDILKAGFRLAAPNHAPDISLYIKGFATLLWKQSGYH